MNAIFSIRLKQLRLEKMKTQQEMADYLDITRAAYSAYERNQMMPRIDKLRQLAAYFNVSVDYLTGVSNEKSEHKSLYNDDIGVLLDYVIEQLKNDYAPVYIHGSVIDDRSKQVMASIIQSAIEVADHLV